MIHCCDSLQLSVYANHPTTVMAVRIFICILGTLGIMSGGSGFCLSSALGSVWIISGTMAAGEADTSSYFRVRSGVQVLHLVFTDM